MMRGNLAGLARYLDKIQKGCRVRIITFPQLVGLIKRVEANNLDYAALDGGRIAFDYGYNGTTTLAIVTKNRSKKIVVGIQRCSALRGEITNRAFECHRLNRGKWHLESTEDWSKEHLHGWANFTHDKYVLDSMGLEL